MRQISSNLDTLVEKYFMNWLSQKTWHQRKRVECLMEHSQYSQSFFQQRHANSQNKIETVIDQRDKTVLQIEIILVWIKEKDTQEKNDINTKIVGKSLTSQA